MVRLQKTKEVTEGWTQRRTTGQKRKKKGSANLPFKD
jgi:hypothetical protein